MPKINNLTRYPYDYVIRDNDFLLGSDAENSRKTKNFPMFAIGAYIDNYVNGGNSDKVLSIGDIIATDSDVTLTVHELGNVVRIGGLIYSKYVEDYFTFTPVTTGIKVLIIYALPDSQIFYLAEGQEALEAIEPDLPEGFLYVSRILVTPEGVEVQPIDLSGFREKRIDGWFPYNMREGENTVSITGLKTMKFRLTKSSLYTAGEIKVVGIKNYLVDFLYDGVPAFFINNTGEDVLITTPSVVIDNNIEIVNSPYILKNNNAVELAYNSRISKFEILKIGTSISNTSELINDGEDGVNPFITAQDIPTPIPQVNADWNATSGVAQILNKPDIPAPVDVSTKAETDASNLTPTNVISWRDVLDVYSKSQVDSALALKLDKPLTDGSWVVTKSGTTISYTDASTFGQNISNSNLTWSADRTQNLNGNKLSFTGGRVSVPALELQIHNPVTNPQDNSVSNKIWTDGVGYYFNNNLGIKKKVAIGAVFTYTPTGNFTISEIKTALEATGMIFNDSHIIINLGSNNYTCSIDIGALNPNSLITIGKRGSTGSISFTSIRTLNSGVESITILNGNEGSMAKIDFGTSSDILTIRNL